MKILANIIVLIFEVVYYSLFIKNCKNECRIGKYITLFSIASIMTLFIGNNLFSYLIFVLFVLYGLKYYVKCKTSLYDLFVIIAMIVIKTTIEFIICNIIYLISRDTFISLLIANVVKVYLVTNKLPINNMYRYMNKLWNNNNFYIRYVSMTLLYIYVIFSVLFLIL